MTARRQTLLVDAAHSFVSWTERVFDLLLVFSGLILAATACVMAYSIGTRKLGNPVAWPDPMVAVLLLWAIFLAAGATYLRGDHVNMDTFIEVFPRRVRITALLVSDLLVAVIAIFLARAGWHVVQWSSSQHEKNPDLPWLAEWLVDLAVVVGAVLLVIGSICAAIRHAFDLSSAAEHSDVK